MKNYDVIIIGAGAAGLSAAATATARGLTVAVLDMGETPARKVLASGGGKCNITNTAAAHDRYFGKNPDFVRGALSRVTPADILGWAHAHNIQVYEKTPGRYFCTEGADQVVRALIQDANNADIFYKTTVSSITKSGNLFFVNNMCAKSVIIATGGISFGTLGVSDAGYKIAKEFGHKIVPARPALCALAIKNWPQDLAGVSINAEISANGKIICDSMLFTHFGIGGPAAYRISLNNIRNGITINLMPGNNTFEILKNAKKTNGKKSVLGLLSQHMPARVAKWVCNNDNRNIADVRDTELQNLAKCINQLVIPGNNLKYHTLSSAEVTYGGIDTCDISSRTMESKLCPGLFFAGEVVDITGDLGGFNLQWAWASGRVAGQNA